MEEDLASHVQDISLNLENPNNSDSNSDEEEATEPQPSPALFIEPILSNILTFLPVADLLNFRTVCKDWDSQIVAHLVLKSLVRVNVYKSEEIASERKHRRRMLEFMSLVKSSSNFLFPDYILTLPDPHVFKTFFGLVGSTMRSLEVETYMDMIMFVHELSRLTPNLKSLHFINISNMTVHRNSIHLETTTYNFEEEWSLPSIKEIIYTHKTAIPSNDLINRGLYSPGTFQWTLLFERTPTLQRISINVSSKAKGSVFLGYYLADQKSPIEQPVLDALKESGRLTSIKSLELSGLTNPTLSLLITEGAKQNMALEELSVKKVSASAMELVHQFLESQQKSLIKLTIGSTCEIPSRVRPARYNQRYDLVRPNHMNALKSLSLKITIDAMLLMTQDPLRDLPNLVKVDIPEIVCDMAEVMSQHFCSLTVQKLKVSFKWESEWEKNRKDHFNSPNTINSLRKMFPAVKYLELSYPSLSQIVKIKGLWSELKHLRLNLRYLEYEKNVMKYLGSGADKVGLSILDLKNLETLLITEQKEDSFDCCFVDRLFLNFT